MAVEEVQTPEPDESEQETAVYEMADPMLENVVRAAHNIDDQHGIGVTLTVNGLVVTGMVIGRSPWLRELKDKFPVMGPIADSWLELFEIDDRQRAGDDSTRFGYIHLRDVRDPD